MDEYAAHYILAPIVNQLIQLPDVVPLVGKCPALFPFTALLIVVPRHQLANDLVTLESCLVLEQLDAHIDRRKDTAYNLIARMDVPDTFGHELVPRLRLHE